MALHDVPDTGRRFQIVANEPTRSAVCAVAQLRELPRLEASFEVVRRGRDTVQVAGRVSATVGQTCVVTLDPILNEVEEDIDVTYTSDAAGAEIAVADIDFAAEDPPEPAIGGVVDLGQIATEFLILGMDPYPRKPGATFELPRTDDSTDHPFAALAALKKSQPGNKS